MAQKKKASIKKPGPAKCRLCKKILEGISWVKIGGKKWCRECAIRAGKKIPREYLEI
ncbi:MAG: hypothetical protein RMJ51_04810 [Candidatus Calescibacterium sp.]|nr:hypothetical protein [Candidatus Calescibacterium sp.]MCX7972735.1 hypothetical protein [bacterium]MDW8195539.1 hypothetical protein [Candidatus Calescibacterium sp.]